MLSIHCKIALFFFIFLFGLSAILKIRNGEHVHYVGLVVAYTWNREKQMFVALGKEFDMLRSFSMTKWRERSKHQIPEGKVKQTKVTTKLEILATLMMTLEASSSSRDLFAQTSGKVQPVFRCCGVALCPKSQSVCLRGS